MATPYWHKAIVAENDTLKIAFQKIDDGAIKLVLCIDEENKLIGVASDGDLRRGLLKDLDLNNSIATLLNRSPLTVPHGTSASSARTLMKKNNIAQIPSVDKQGKLVGIFLADEFKRLTKNKNKMVVMVGGKGTRLRPFTNDVPKPMVNVAGKPMLEHIILRAKDQGFEHFILCIYHLGEMIQEHFGDGSHFNVNIEYVSESLPLGTAGALSLLKPYPDETFIVTNGDVLADINYSNLLDCIDIYKATAVVATKEYEIVNPYGVVEIEENKIVAFKEKPISRSNINTGIYAIKPEILNFLQKGEYCDMPDLLSRAVSGDKVVAAYPMYEPWLDVGRPSDLKIAKATYAARSGDDY